MNNIVQHKSNPITNIKKEDYNPIDKDKFIKKGRTIVKMYKQNGVYEIPTLIDGVPMRFIFDALYI